MGISISGSNASSGLSGHVTEFDKVLENLQKIESTQLNKLEAWKSDWNLRYEAFTQIIEQIQAASSMLSQLSDKNNFVTKNVVSSNDNIITAVANASAQDVQHTVKVAQTASNAIWANTGHVFDSKTDIINTTGQTQYFKFSYGGEYREFKVPANTTLESFQSMVNNSSDNPGIKISLLQTGNGYVFQVAGKDTGVDKDLIIYDCNLEGMKNTASTSTTWMSNNTVTPSDSISDPGSYIFDIVLDSGVKKTVTLKGDATADDLVAALNNAGGITASVDASGQLTLQGVQSFSRRKSSDAAYTPASTRFELPGAFQDSGTREYVKLNAAGGLADGKSDTDIITFTVTMEDGGTRTVDIEAGATKRDLYLALGQATQSGDGIDVGIDNSGNWGVKLSGVTAIAVSGATDASRMTQTLTAASGVKDTLGGQLAADATLKFETGKLGDRIDGKTSGDGEDLVYSVIDKDGNEHRIKLKSDATNQDLLDAVKTALGITDPDGADGDYTTVKLNGVKEFRLSQGGVSKPAYSSSLAATVVVDATNSNPGTNSTGNLFYQETPGGGFTLEKAPDLVYTIKTTDGKTGVLTLPSGTSMLNVVRNLKHPNTDTWGGKWKWTDADGNSTTTPNLGLKLTDKDGNEYLGPDGKPLLFSNIDGPVYVQFTNVQEVSGPGISGQIAASSNWNIQRSSNAVFQIDNWPVEMESSTNTITDAIEGVVVTIQEVGDARISVSTDITSVEQSIQNFLDAVNSVLLTVNDLMKYDEDKEVTSNDPDDIGNDNYSPSGLTNQKGSLLTGNYGVQLFKSRFSSLLSTSPPGFKAQQTASDILSGDVLASLSGLGIKTDTDATSDTYGLLVRAPSSSIAQLQTMDKENYNDLITNHLEAVVDFFCSSGAGSSTSTDFRYGSHIEGITKAGVYDVSYTVEADGSITNVMVGGEPARQDTSMPGNYFSVASGDARGLSILIDNVEPGDHPPAGETMQVRIKQGLVQATNEFLKAELVFNDVNISATSTPEQIADAVALKSKNGALMSLRDNYMKVMESIDVKIEREQRRIDTWYNRQKTIFANLETLLNNYGEQQKSLESQLKQLDGNS